METHETLTTNAPGQDISPSALKATAINTTAAQTRSLEKTVSPQAGTPYCPTCGGGPAGAAPMMAAPQYVYALGRIEPRFPTLSVEKEFAQATGRAPTEGLTDRQALAAVLSKPENRYLARQLCWVFTIEGLETYILVPRDPVDFTLLIDALRSNPTPADMDVVIGVKGPMAPPTMCNGLMVPLVAFDQIYSFDRDTLIKSIPKPKDAKTDAYRAAAEELLARILQMADNAGATDEDRALNYLVVRYPAIYSATGEAYARDASLTAVEVQPSPLSGTEKMFEVIFSFTNRNTDVVEKFCTLVNLSGEFPFLVRKLSPYFDR